MKTTPLALHAALGITLVLITLWWVPSETDLWRKVLIGILSVTCGHHIATALMSPPAQRAQVWLECLAFPLMILGLLSLWTSIGWILVISGFLWRSLVKRVL